MDLHPSFLCPLSSRVCSKPYSLSRCCYLTVSSSVTPFSFCLQSFPASVFPMSQSFVSDGQSIPVNIHGWFPLVLTGLISLLPKGLSRVFSTTVWRHQFFSTQPSLWTNSQICAWPLEKLQLWLYRPLLANWRLCFALCCLDLS